MAIVTVALAGTPEAATADFVCDGSDDNIEIAAAIAQLAALGGGTLQIAGGVYSTSRPIIVEHDNIQIVGAADRSTIIRPASNWVSIFTAGGAQPTGVVSFVGVDNFAARNLVVESTTLPMNGIIAIPDGPEGTGQVSTNGVFDNNVVRMAQAHTYSIWSLLSAGMTITNNLVDGGATFSNANVSQEGIEIFGGDDIVISGNTVINMGNAAINLVSLSAILPDTHLTNIQVKDNIIDSSRIGIFIGSTYSNQNGSANITNLEIDGNIITNGFEGGIFLEMQDGISSDPTLLDNLTISNNQIEVLSNSNQNFVSAALYFDGKNDVGLNISSNINIFNNNFELKSTSATLPAPSRISTSNSRFVIFYNFEDIVFEDNLLSSDVENLVTNAISTFLSDQVEIRSNDITGFLGFGVEVSNSSNLVIDDNRLLEWGGYVDYFAILVASSSNVVVSANDVESPANFQGPIAANIFSTNVSFLANRMIADRDFSIAGTNYRDLLLTDGGIVAVGSNAQNYLEGNALANTLDGGAGADTLAGLGGDDVYIIDNAGDVVIEAVGEGVDEVRTSVSWDLGAGVEVEKIGTTNAAGTSAINLTGNALVQELTGNAGANVLDGGAGADTLRGLAGNDVYVIDNVGDVVIEAADEGSDEVRAAVSYTLGANVFVERLVTNDAAVTTAIDLTGNAHVLDIVGNAGVNVLTGGSGNNVLDGGAGADTLAGLGGDDVYIIDNAGDVVVEAAGEGNDELRASVSYALGVGASVERLVTTNAAGTSALNLTGNALVQEITGNAGANVLDGAGGNDTLRGLGGDDTYIIDNAGVTIIETAGNGYDTLATSISYTLGTGLSIELLKLKDAVATTALNLTGNELGNRLEGNAGVNILNGGSGIDVLVGFGGNDVYYLDNASDQIIEGSDEGTNDVAWTSVSYTLEANSHVEILSTLTHAATTAINLTGNSFRNQLIGNAGANILDGGGASNGRDTLQGFGGDDIYIIRQGNEIIFEGVGEGTDEVRSAVNFTLTATAQIERIATIDAAATTALTLRGNELAQEITGNAGANTLDGGAGADVLRGLAGDDLYIVDNAGDQIIEAAGEGFDEVRASTSYTLANGVHVERLATNNAASITSVSLSGNEQAQELVGDVGANTLDGGGGADILRGLGGNDVYIVDDASDQVIEAIGEGIDEVRASVSFALASDSYVEKLVTTDASGISAINLTGNALVQEVIGNAGANILDGGAGADSLSGLGGDDIYRIDDAGDQINELLNDGIDEARATVSYALGANVHVEKLTTNDAAGLTAINLTGNAFAQELTGNAGANVLDGGAGADAMRGLGGDDIYLVDNISDTVIEDIAGGNDEVRTSVDFTLGSDVHVEKLRATDAAATGALNLTGNAFGQEIIGNAGSNSLDGGSGVDLLRGLGGDDVYFVDSFSDQVLENIGDGIDEVRTSVSWVLGAGIEVEKLATTNAAGTGAINLTGNELTQELTGNAGTNTLDGGAGADTLAGLGGDDVYIVDDAGDVVVEAVGEGSDEVRASVSYALGVGASVERLVTTNAAGTSALNLTGNALVQEITGNAGANVLDGAGGNDTLRGLGGDDTYIIDNAGVTIIETAGNGYDTLATSISYTLGTGLSIELLKLKDAAATTALNLTGNELGNRLEGNAGVNILNGGSGIDVLVGFGGNDVYYLDNASDQIIEGSDEGTNDVAWTSVSYTLEANSHVEILSTLTHAATTAINLTGNSFRNQLIGNAGANILDGGGASNGRDTLQGFGGDDIYIIRQGNEIIFEGVGEGTDEVRSAVNFTLTATAQIERIATIDAAATTALTLRGNELAQEITGNAGANTLDGGAGADVLRGLAGDDLYIVDNAGDQIIEAAGEGFDEVRASTSYTLANGVHVERLATTNANATVTINLTANDLVQELVGNAGVNSLTGNALANILDGGAGADTLAGLAGDDVYIIDNAGDVVVEAVGEGVDEVRTSVSWALGAGVEIEKLATTNAAGTGAINLTGNALVQELTGNAGANTLDGGSGADTLRGLAGNDVYIIDDAGDVVIEAAGEGTDEVRSSVSYTLGTNVYVERLVTNDAAGITALDLKGNAHVLDIIGNAGVNVLTGGSGNNTLDGGAGADTLAGLGGDDVYIIDNAGDVVIEAVGEGVDEVRTSVSWDLGAGVEVEKIGTTNAAGTSAINLTGNALVQELTGNAGANVLDGGAGADTLRGLAGNDVYVIDNVGDVVIEAADEGSDEVRAAVSYTLGANVFVERLVTNDAAVTTAIDLTGNAHVLDIVGNAGVNVLTGGSGNNVLDGGAGADTLAGLGGDDVYIIDNAGDVVVEAAGEGNDELRASVSYALGVGASVERLVTTNAAGTSALNLTGNALVQEITGNAGANVLDGAGGNDTLRGLGGDDTYIIDNAGVTIIETAGNGYDTLATSISYTLGTGLSIELLKLKDAAATTALNLTGNELGNRLEGNAGVNILNGGSGIDVLVGFGGNDVYYLDNASDQIIEGSDEGTNDVAWTSVSYTLEANSHVEILSTLTHAATTAINLTGNSFRNQLIGNAGANILDGGGASNGRDTLQGFGGDDIYIIRQGNEIIFEGVGEGTDEVRSAVNFTLTATAQIERIATIDAAATTALTLRGNELAQEITGNAGANTLDGGAGADVLWGLEGNDALFGGSGTDIAKYRGLRVDYSIVTGSGSLQIIDNNAAVDGDDGTDTLVGVEFAEFKNGERVGLMSPIILDLDGNGVETLKASESGASFDMDGDGIGDDSSWFGSTEGLLVLDRDGNGTLSNAGEFSFVDDVEGARSDLEGLRAFDSNADGELSALDERFGNFLVWADRDGDGVVDSGEMLTLTEVGVASINLTGEAVNAVTGLDDVAVINKGSYTRTDGNSMEFLDVALTYVKGNADEASGSLPAVSENPSADAAVALLKSQQLKAPEMQLADLMRESVNGFAADAFVAATEAKPRTAPRLDITTHSDSAIPLLLQINQAMASFSPRDGEADKGAATETVQPLDYFT